MGSLGRKLLIDRIYPALSKHEIGTSEDRELVVRWQSETEGAAKELDRILEEQKKRDAEGPHCDSCGSPVREEAPSLGMPQ
jgi:transcription termination factor Rho